MEEEVRHRPRLLWIRWMASIFIVLGAVFVAFLLLTPKPLVIKGALKTKDGPVPAGTYDFRLKFYEATTRTDLVYSYDAKAITVDEAGNFETTIPAGNNLKVATLMQVCIASPRSAVPGTITGGKATLPSCEVAEGSNQVAFNQTICGLTAVDQNPTNTVSWLATKNVVYATPTKACSPSGEGVASISDEDVVAPLIETPGSLGELLGGVGLQPGTVLTVDENGQIVGVPPAEIPEATTPAPSQVTNVYNTYPTIVGGEPNTDSQTLALSGSVLTISGGNSVTLPSGSGGPEQDGVIGNEITDVVASSGLVRVGVGTTVDPFRVGLITCASGQVIKSTGPGTWGCAADTDTVYSAGTGISFSGTVINNTGVISFTLPAGGGLANTGSSQSVSLKLQDCANGEILQFNAGAWGCVAPGGASPYSFAITDSTTTQPILNGDTVTFIGNEGLLATVTAADNVTYGIINGGVTNLKLADGSVSTAKIVDGAVTTIKLGDGSVTNAKLANSSLTVSAGAGLSGGGVVALGASTTLNLQPCASGQILKHNGTTWACAADSGDTNTDNQTLSILASAPDGANTVAYTLSISGGNSIVFDDRDTVYTAATSGGLALNGTAFSLQTCPVGQLLKSTNAVTPAYACATDIDTDTNTTYSAGTGLSLVGTTFNNTGVLSVAGAGAITSSGGQNPTIAFANGSATGQFWQWDGDSWELATLGAEQDTVIGNEVTNVTGANSGLVRSGTGTAVDPYTLAVSVGNGLQLSSGSVAINSPTCAGTTKLQWTGTAFVCAADVDTNTTYSAGTGLSLVGTTFNNTGVLGVTGSGAITSSGGQNPNIAFANGSVTGQFWQWDGDSWELATLGAESDSVIGNEVTNVTGINSGLVRSGTGTAIDPYTLAANVGNGLQIASNTIQINSPTCSGTDKLQWTGTAFLCSADVDTDTNTTYTAGNGLQLAGTSFSINSPTCAGTTKLQWTGSAFVCSADVDTNTDAQTLAWVDGTRTLSISGGNSVVIPDTNTTYSALANSGLRLVGTEFGLSVCAAGEILKAQVTSGEYACAADTDTNTTYSAGTGLSLVGTTFNNTGVLGVTGSGAITSSGGQNPDIAFADGSVTGQFWQWDGDSWELATLAAEQDAVIGNEVTNVTGANSGLVRSGAGTAVDPYTLAVSVGNGLQLSSGSVAINSPTCAGTTKLQWTGTAFVCSADVDTDTNTTYTADGQGIELTGTTFSLELDGASLSKSASGLTLNLSNANTWAALQTFGAGVTITTGQALTVNGDAFTDLTGTGLTIAAGVLQTTLGTSVDLGTEVTGVLPVANGGTALSAVGAANQLLGTNAAGTALEYKNLSSLLVAGSGISLSGTSTVTVTNTGAAATCVVTSNYACNGGNTLGAALTLGTNDAQSFIFETNNATAMTILSGGNVGIGVSPTEKLDVNGNINIPTTSSTVGVIKQNGARFIHTAGGTTNFFAGTTAGNLTLTGTHNTGVGNSTLQSLTSGSFNNALGSQALKALTTGINNSAFGNSALVLATTGSSNTAIGFNVLAANVSGSDNTAVGAAALTSNTSSNNSAFGVQALGSNTTGTGNTAIGMNTLRVNVIGNNNSALGINALQNSTANDNSAFGAGALNATTTGANNNAFGVNALLNNVSGEYNAAFGGGALQGSTGNRNSAIGQGAGVTSVGANTNTTGSENTFLGFETGLGSTTQRNNATAIGAHTVVNQDDSLVLGCTSGVNGCGNSTRVGIRNAAPQQELEVDGDIRLDSTGTGTAFGLCHSGANSTGTFVDRDIVACSGAPSDAAEWYETEPGVEAGDLVMTSDKLFAYEEELFDPVTGPTGRKTSHSISVLAKGQKGQTGRILGVISTNPYQVFGESVKEAPNVKNPKPLALAGRVPIKVTTENGSIKVGDPLAPASIPGHAMKATRPGMIVGYALEAFSGSAGKIDVFISTDYFGDMQTQIDDLKKGLLAGGIVTKDITFKASAIFEGPVRFTGSATFTHDVSIMGKLKLSGDQVNQAVLPAGSRRVSITFRGAYARAPHITTTPREFMNGQYRVTKVTSTGFVIEAQFAQPKDLHFDWHAFAKQ